MYKYIFIIVVVFGVLSAGALGFFGTKLLPEGNVTTGIEGGMSAVLTVGDQTHPLYFEGGAGEVLQQIIADDLAIIFGHAKEISFRERAVPEEGVTMISLGKYPVSYEATDDEINLPFTHWFSFPGVRTLRPEAMEDEFTRVVTHNNRKYLVVTKDLIEAYRAAWQQEQKYAEAYEKLDSLFSALNDLAQEKISVNELPRSVPEMFYLKGLSNELVEGLHSPEAIQNFERNFKEISGVRKPSILDVFDRRTFRKWFVDIDGVTFPGKLYTVLYDFDQDGKLSESNWPYMYVDGDWKIYIIESLLGSF